MNEDQEIALLKRMESAGVRFYAELPAETFFLSAEEALELARNPDMTMLQLFNCTRDDVREWQECGGTVMCSATTKAGKPCRGVVRNAVYPVSAWLRLKEISPLCHAHSNP